MVCPHCAIVESVTYCRSCASTLLDAPDVQGIEPFEPHEVHGAGAP